MSNEVATLSLKQAVRAPAFQDALRTQLPSNITLERFTNTALAAAVGNKDLDKCDRQSIYDSIVKAAQQGLLPDGREGAIVAFGKTATWMPMVAGIIKRLAESKIFIEAQVVAVNDFFEQEFGDNPRIAHQPPALGVDRGGFAGVYAIAKLPNGLIYREVMDKGQIDAVRAASRSGNGPAWSSWYGEMARKSVIRRLAKRLPSIDQRTQDAINAEDDDFEFSAAGEAPATPEPAPATMKRPKALQAVVDQVKPAAPLETTTSFLGASDSDSHADAVTDGDDII